MSFTLKSIELKNIKTHEYLLFEPALEGITAISGENGAGKSTIVDSLAWCLYGTRPSGVKNKNFIKEKVDPRKKPVNVKTVLFVGGIEYVIEKKIITPAGATECNVWGKNPESEELSHVAGPAVSHVEKFIRSELGMNEKGFLTSVLIQQKQVDQIVSASPRERGIVIEELTGIASITQAIMKINDDVRALEKAASIFTIGNIEEIKEKVEKQKLVCNNVKQKEQSAIKMFNEMKVIHKEIKDDLDIQQAKVNQRIKLNQEVDKLKGQIDFLKKQADDDINYILNFKKKYGTTIYIDVADIKQKVESKRKESYSINNMVDNINNELINIKDNINKCKILKGIFKNEKEASKELMCSNKKLIDITKKLEDNKNKKAVIIAELKHSEESYEHIDGENTNCPTCKSHIKDPEELKNQIKNEIKTLKKNMSKITISINGLIAEDKKLKEHIKDVTIAIEAIKEEKRLISKKNSEDKKLKDNISKKDIVDADLKSLEIEYDKALRVEADKNALNAAKKRSLTVNSTIDNNQKKVDEILKRINELNALSDRSLQGLITRASNAQNRLTKMSIAGKEIRGRKILELERLKDNEDNLKKVEDAMKKYNEIAEKINVSTSASAMLAAFKADRIEQSIPTLEFFASDFLSKFTGGAFTKMTVDDKFNTFVTTSSGMVRPVSQLSGGELSSTAIALRLGIAMLLNSSEKNVLILDEVLVSMDEDRSRQIMETIGSMTSSQIIFIAHNSDINSVADKTVLISKK